MHGCTNNTRNIRVWGRARSFRYQCRLDLTGARDDGVRGGAPGAGGFFFFFFYPLIIEPVFVFGRLDVSCRTALSRRIDRGKQRASGGRARGVIVAEFGSASHARWETNAAALPGPFPRLIIENNNETHTNTGRQHGTSKIYDDRVYRNNSQATVDNDDNNKIEHEIGFQLFFFSKTNNLTDIYSRQLLFIEIMLLL